MKWEKLGVVLGAIFLGLLVAAGGYSLFQFFKQAEIGPKVWPTPGEKATPLPTKVLKVFKIEITSPEEQALSQKELITVEGKTRAKVLVVITGELGFEVVKSDNDGSFSKEIRLEEGGNTLVVTAYDQKEVVLEERKVVYVPTKE